MMDKGQLHDLIFKLEKHHNVWEFQESGLHLWPFVRFYLHFHSKSNKRVKAGSKTKQNTLRNIFRYKILDWKHDVRKLSNADVAFAFTDTHRSEIVDGRYFHKFADPLYQLVPGKKLFIEPLNRFKSNIPRYSRTYCPNVDFLIESQVNKRLKKGSGVDIQGLNTLAEIVNHEADSEIVKKHQLQHIFNKFLEYKRAYRRILSRINPKIVFLSVFYSNHMQGLIAACHELGIKVVEVQHGQQGDGHLCYTNWHNYPSNGVALFPDIWWMWGNISAKRISDWFPHRIGVSEVIVGGNPWFYQNLMDTANNDTSKNKSWNNIIPGDKTNILLSLQFMEDFYDGYLPDVMSNEKLPYHWHIRLHPKFRGEIPQLKTFLQSRGCRNYEIDDANEMPLFELFKHVDFNVTFWSTVAYEAELFGVKNIIVHPFGRDSMSNFISEGVFAYAEDGKAFVSAINDHDFKKPSEPYLVADEQHIQAGLSHCLEMVNLKG